MIRFICEAEREDRGVIFVWNSYVYYVLRGGGRLTVIRRCACGRQLWDNCGERKECRSRSRAIHAQKEY